MKSRKVASVTYLIIFLACIWQSTGYISSYRQSEYEKAIETMSYQLKYRNAYATPYSEYSQTILETAAEEENTTETQQKTVYLTFDDGPTTRTGEILDILKKYDVKATFFVIKNKEEYVQYMQRAVAEGHTIGVHSASHKYKEIYKSVDSYLSDFTECYDYIYAATGYSPTIFRFPGGSVNNYNADTRRDIVREMSRRGFVYFDWNVESNDSSSNLSADTIYNNVIKGCKGKQRAVVIMHDSIGKKTTVEALDRIIPSLKEDGWTFAPLANEVKPVIFKMK